MPPFRPDFRWLRDRDDCPWHPTAKLFRQTTDGGWGGVVSRIAEELNGLFAAGTQLSSNKNSA